MDFRFRLIIAVILFSALISVAAEQAVRAEAVFLKDGPIIFGKIISDTSDALTIQTDDGKKVVVKRDDLMRVLYTQLKMGKVYIQKRDGKGLTAFVVDEDQVSYTCRKELFQPEEFIIKRSDILFMAEKNPSGLQVVGNVGTDSVTLTWLPPYGDVKKYNVYFKQNDKDAYELAGSSKTKTITLEKLKSNTEYFLIVNSVDLEDYESPPSNEITITTLNIHPTRPVIASTARSGGKGTTVRWEPSIDPDGQVTAYRVYVWKMNKREKLTDVKTTEFTFDDPALYDSAEVTAVDNKGEESTPASLPLYGEYFTVGFYPGFILPLGKFGKITGPGFGAAAAFNLNNYFYDNLVLGGELGVYSFMGKNALSSEHKKTKSVMMATFLLTGGYNFQMTPDITLMPYLGMGLVYLNVNYTDRNAVTLVDTNKKLSEVGPGIALGGMASYRFSTSLKGVLRVSVGYLAGSNGIVYVGCDVGAIYKL
jgi:fibronectin type 3 domain-containing protein/RNase P/RNase MRP subunit p29